LSHLRNFHKVFGTSTDVLCLEIVYRNKTALALNSASSSEIIIEFKIAEMDESNTAAKHLHPLPHMNVIDK
jgi:hypothetical protein